MTATTEKPFVVEAVHDDDGSRTVLFETDSSVEAIRWLSRYTRRLDDNGRAGGWGLIEVYDLRDEEGYGERIAFWEEEA
jgi:hypothetical protein